MPRGTVEFYGGRKPNGDERCFGFIEADHLGKSFFVHKSEVDAAGLIELMPGDRLEFDVVTNPRRRGQVVAANLRRID